MAVANGYGRTVTSGSVFMYDVADTRNSFIGEPTTNVFTQYGTAGYGSESDNAVNFNIQGTSGFVRLGYGQTFGGYTIKPTDVVYKYPLGGYGCHYHGNSAAIGSGKYATFSFDYYVSPGTTIENSYLANFENYGGSALGGGVSAPNSLTGVWQTVTLTLGPTGGSGTQAMFLYPGACGGRFGDTGFILYKNPQVEFLPHKTPFVNGTRSATQGLLPLISNTSIDLSNVSFDSNAQMIFDGTNDYIDLGYAPFSGTGDFTIDTVYTLNTTDTHTIIGNYPASSLQFMGRYGLYINGSCYFPSSLGPGTYHATATRESGVCKLYLNGVLVNTVSNSNNIGTNSFVMGKNTSGGEVLNGKVPVIKLYNRALSAAEVRQNYNNYKSRFNLS